MHHVIYMHGFASSPQSTKAAFLAERLRRHGIELQCPDFNQPDFEHLTVTRMLGQVDEALAALPPGPVALIRVEPRRIRGRTTRPPATPPRGGRARATARPIRPAGAVRAGLRIREDAVRRAQRRRTCAGGKRPIGTSSSITLRTGREPSGTR